MTGPYWEPTPAWAPPPPPPRPPVPWFRKPVVWIIVGAVVVIAIVAGIVGANGSKHHKAQAAAVATTASGQSSTPRLTTPTSQAVTSASFPTSTFSTHVPPPPPTPNPDGHYHGDCDYTLATNFSDEHAGDFIGDVRVHNTGNIGIKLQVRMQWAQVGYAPIKIIKFVKLPYQGRKTVRFHKQATYNMIDRYQDAGDGEDCHFKAAIIDTFGHAHR